MLIHFTIKDNCNLSCTTLYTYTIPVIQPFLIPPPLYITYGVCRGGGTHFVFGQGCAAVVKHPQRRQRGQKHTLRDGKREKVPKFGQIALKISFFRGVFFFKVPKFGQISLKIAFFRGYFSKTFQSMGKNIPSGTANTL